MSPKKKTRNAIEILHARYLDDSAETQVALERDQLNFKVAQMIYDFRSAAGLNQKQLAELIGTTQSVISRLEDADYDGHSLTMLNRIASALGKQLNVSFADQTSSKEVRRSASQKNRISEVVYETAKGLQNAGLIGKKTARNFEELSLPQVPNYTPAQIKAIRRRCQKSQEIFAAYMNVKPSLLEKWESGARKPDSVARKLLNLIDKKGFEILVD